MLIIPAVDIKDGKCVRLTQGRADTAVVYKNDPVEAALHWQEKGAEYIHLVDLDGAFKGNEVNFDVIKDILKSISIPAEIGGGIRTLETVEKYFLAGADRIILGTQALKDISFLKEAINKYGDRIAVAIDVSGKKVVIEGWVRATDTSASDLSKKLETLGVKTVIYTDTASDGMLKGPNFPGINDFVKHTNLKTIISGGISSKNDITGLKKLEQDGVKGIIIGKALYTGKIKPEEIWTG